ncbi:hypothetical protein ABTZ78_17310 [Streptomyces bauhiniae]|uniref:hypothetical protein n=1 Tax=Streptomyces bauhiniae TaxID=2340725 RepID=UPI00332E5ED4
MSENLPPALREIRDAFLQAKPSSGAAQYFYDFGHEGQALAMFSPETPLPLPAVGDEIKLYGSTVKVTRVSTAYESDEENPGSPAAVSVSIDVEPLPEG